jgi:hypothetical protein
MKIEVSGHSDTIVIINDLYPNQVYCIGREFFPNIGVPYNYIKWSDEVWEEKYWVDLENTIQEFTQTQLEYLTDLTTNWEQPLGQDGNPTFEQQKESRKQEPMGYLSSTDWYYARKMETGEEVPADVVEKRLAARELIRSIEAE